jgi:hypothetical protein
MTREIRIEGDVAYVPLMRGYEAKIDACDVHLVDGVNWAALVSNHRDGRPRTVYAQRIVARRGVFMHRVIMQISSDLQVDHIDGNGLNNQRDNIRAVTPSQNSQNQRIKANNKSGIKGVRWDKIRCKWVAEIGVNRKGVHLGRFDAKEDAASAYATASARIHGNFGRTS